MQVTQEVYQILHSRGYPLTCRGAIEVKGKGNMVTYFLDGYANKPPTNITINPLGNILFQIINTSDFYEEIFVQLQCLFCLVGNGSVTDITVNTPDDKIITSSHPTLETINEKN